MAHTFFIPEAIMDSPFYGDPELTRRARVPVALGLLIALIVVVLGAAALAAAVTPDTRDFATRHATVIERPVL
jgi:hypothetical protein